MPDIYVDPREYKESKVPEIIIKRAIEKLKASPVRDTNRKGKWEEKVEVDDVVYVCFFKALNNFHIVTGFRRARKQ